MHESFPSSVTASPNGSRTQPDLAPIVDSRLGSPATNLSGPSARIIQSRMLHKSRQGLGYPTA